jgi:hypothetical protein
MAYATQMKTLMDAQIVMAAQLLESVEMVSVKAMKKWVALMTANRCPLNPVLRVETWCVIRAKKWVVLMTAEALEVLISLMMAAIIVPLDKSQMVVVIVYMTVAGYLVPLGMTISNAVYAPHSMLIMAMANVFIITFIMDVVNL